MGPFKSLEHREDALIMSLVSCSRMYSNVIRLFVGIELREPLTQPLETEAEIHPTRQQSKQDSRTRREPQVRRQQQESQPSQIRGSREEPRASRRPGPTSTSIEEDVGTKDEAVVEVEDKVGIKATTEVEAPTTRVITKKSQ